MEEFAARMQRAATQALPKSPLGRAIVYAQNQWPALGRYVDHGRLAISNNAAERSLRGLAVGRKHRLFFQCEGGGTTAAILVSLLMTANAAWVNAQDYFRDVLTRISTCIDVKQLTPHGLRQHFEPEFTGRRQALLEQLVGER